jgi:hypothetical protein
MEDLTLTTQLAARDVDEALVRLQTSHALALAPGSNNIWMAPPFSAVPTPFPVVCQDRRYWANCAWDALGVAALLGVPSETRTQCADCGESLTLRVSSEGVEPSTAVVHFLVPPKRFWDNLGFT